MMSENCPKMRERLRLCECATMTNDQDQAAAVRSQTRQQQCDQQDQATNCAIKRPGNKLCDQKTRRQTVRSPLDNRSNAGWQLSCDQKDQTTPSVPVDVRSKRPGTGWELGCDQKDQTTPRVGEEEMDGREDRQQGDDVGR